MKTMIAVFAFALTLGIAQYAAAQGESDVAYQATLRVRQLTPADAQICQEKAGAAGTPAYEACKVTRLFVSDINAGKEKGFPPMADIKYAVDKVEKGKIMDRM